MEKDGNSLKDEFCLVCGKLAENWGGHIHVGSLVVLAGWCEKHYQKYVNPDWILPIPKCTLKGEGCFGLPGELEILVEEKEIEDATKERISEAKKQAGYL